MVRSECTSDRLYVFDNPSAACWGASGEPTLWFSSRWGKKLARLAHHAVGESGAAVADVMLFPGYSMPPALLLQRHMQPQMNGKLTVVLKNV